MRLCWEQQDLFQCRCQIAHLFALAHCILTSSIIRHKFRADPAVGKQAPWEPVRFIRISSSKENSNAVLISKSWALEPIEPYVFWFNVQVHAFKLVVPMVWGSMIVGCVMLKSCIIPTPKELDPRTGSTSETVAHHLKR